MKKEKKADPKKNKKTKTPKTNASTETLENENANEEFLKLQQEKMSFRKNLFVSTLNMRIIERELLKKKLTSSITLAKKLFLTYYLFWMILKEQ